MSIKIKMTIDECIEFAREWSKGCTFHEGSQGWRVVCMLLAEEVQRLRGVAEQEQEPVAWMSPGKERLEFARVDTVYGSHTIPLYTHAAPANQPSVPREDIELAMQMLTWGRDEGLTAEQDKQVLAHQRKLHTMLAAAPEAPAPAQWQELSEEEVIDALHEDGCERIENLYLVGPVQKSAVFSFADAISAALRAKNGATNED